MINDVCKEFYIELKKMLRGSTELVTFVSCSN